MSGRADAAIRLVRAAARSAGLGQRTDPELLAAFLAGPFSHVNSGRPGS
jgi:hypothetical protein